MISKEEVRQAIQDLKVRKGAGMQLISRHQATRTWNEGSRKSSREKVETGSRDRQDAVWV